jgi:hypothetical protein
MSDNDSELKGESNDVFEAKSMRGCENEGVNFGFRKAKEWRDTPSNAVI